MTDRNPLDDPRTDHPGDAQELDPASGASDDPRVDPTPDLRQTEDDAEDSA